jgi:hypothetical protein
VSRDDRTQRLDALRQLLPIVNRLRVTARQAEIDARTAQRFIETLLQIEADADCRRRDALAVFPTERVR